MFSPLASSVGSYSCYTYPTVWFHKYFFHKNGTSFPFPHSIYNHYVSMHSHVYPNEPKQFNKSRSVATFYKYITYTFKLALCAPQVVVGLQTSCTIVCISFTSQQLQLFAATSLWGAPHCIHPTNSDSQLYGRWSPRSTGQLGSTHWNRGTWSHLGPLLKGAPWWARGSWLENGERSIQTRGKWSYQGLLGERYSQVKWS